MEIIILVLIVISLCLAFAYLKKSSALSGASSMLSITSHQVSGLNNKLLHNYWACLVMAIMQHKKCSFEEAVVLLKMGNSHPDIVWGEVENIYEATTDRAKSISLEFDNFIKEDAELIIKENSGSIKK